MVHGTARRRTEALYRWAAGRAAQVSLYYQLGLSRTDFKRLLDQRPELFQLGVPTVRSKLKFLREEVRP